MQYYQYFQVNLFWQHLGTALRTLFAPPYPLAHDHLFPTLHSSPISLRLSSHSISQQIRPRQASYSHPRNGGTAVPVLPKGLSFSPPEYQPKPFETTCHLPLGLQQAHITVHSSPYMARSTSRLTWYQSARRCANSYTSSARKTPPNRSPSAMTTARSLACLASTR